MNNDLHLYAGNFDRSFIDFSRGIRVGHLEPNQRITQIVKAVLVARHEADMTCDRWGRGVYWRWICWVPRPNRDAKPVSSGHNFGSAKFFISVDPDEHTFSAGMQIERAPDKPSSDSFGVSLKSDWDWHVMLKALKGRGLPREIKRLLGEGFLLRMGRFEEPVEYSSGNWNAAACRRAAAKSTLGDWRMFQLAFHFPEKEVKNMSGSEIVEAVIAIFEEVTVAMNSCMYHPCLKPQPDDEFLNLE